MHTRPALRIEMGISDVERLRDFARTLWGSDACTFSHEALLDWISGRPENCHVLYSDSTLAGFLISLPLGQETAIDILEERALVRDLRGKDLVAPTSTGPVWLYLAEILVDQSHPDARIMALTLIRHFRAFVRDAIVAGRRVDHIVGLASTAAGEALLRSMQGVRYVRQSPQVFRETDGRDDPENEPVPYLVDVRHLAAREGLQIA